MRKFDTQISSVIFHFLVPLTLQSSDEITPMSENEICTCFNNNDVSRYVEIMFWHARDYDHMS